VWYFVNGGDDGISSIGEDFAKAIVKVKTNIKINRLKKDFDEFLQEILVDRRISAKKNLVSQLVIHAREK
jgi:hypothetical protein